MKSRTIARNLAEENGSFQRSAVEKEQSAGPCRKRGLLNCFFEETKLPNLDSFMNRAVDQMFNALVVKVF